MLVFYQLDQAPTYIHAYLRKCSFVLFFFFVSEKDYALHIPTLSYPFFYFLINLPIITILNR